MPSRFRPDRRASTGPTLGRRLRRVLSDNRERLQIPIRCAELGCRLLPVNMFGRGRSFILRLAGAQTTPRTFVYGTLGLHGERASASRLRLGREVVISPNCSIDLTADVTIEDGAAIGHDVMIITSDHAIGPPHARCGPGQPNPVRIGRGAWIGARATILPGVTIGAGSIVGAGSTVYHDVPPNTMVSGSPARAIRRLGSDSTDAGERPPLRLAAGGE